MSVKGRVIRNICHRDCHFSNARERIVFGGCIFLKDGNHTEVDPLNEFMKFPIMCADMSSTMAVIR